MFIATSRSSECGTIIMGAGGFVNRQERSGRMRQGKGTVAFLTHRWYNNIIDKLKFGEGKTTHG
jgi:hypothetical protein